jgi:hypothetical protein
MHSLSERQRKSVVKSVSAAGRSHLQILKSFIVVFLNDMRNVTITVTLVVQLLRTCVYEINHSNTVASKLRGFSFTLLLMLAQQVISYFQRKYKRK